MINTYITTNTHFYKNERKMGAIEVGEVQGSTDRSEEAANSGLMGRVSASIWVVNSTGDSTDSEFYTGMLAVSDRPLDSRIFAIPN